MPKGQLSSKDGQQKPSVTVIKTLNLYQANSLLEQFGQWHNEKNELFLKNFRIELDPSEKNLNDIEKNLYLAFLLQCPVSSEQFPYFKLIFSNLTNFYKAVNFALENDFLFPVLLGSNLRNFKRNLQDQFNKMQSLLKKEGKAIYINNITIVESLEHIILAFDALRTKDIPSALLYLTEITDPNTDSKNEELKNQRNKLITSLLTALIPEIQKDELCQKTVKTIIIQLKSNPLDHWQMMLDLIQILKGEAKLVVEVSDLISFLIKNELTPPTIKEEAYKLSSFNKSYGNSKSSTELLLNSKSPDGELLFYELQQSAIQNISNFDFKNLSQEKLKIFLELTKETASFNNNENPKTNRYLSFQPQSINKDTPIPEECGNSEILFKK